MEEFQKNCCTRRAALRFKSIKKGSVKITEPCVFFACMWYLEFNSFVIGTYIENHADRNHTCNY